MGTFSARRRRRSEGPGGPSDDAEAPPVTLTIDPEEHEVDSGGETDLEGPPEEPHALAFGLDSDDDGDGRDQGDSSGGAGADVIALGAILIDVGAASIDAAAASVDAASNARGRGRGGGRGRPRGRPRGSGRGRGLGGRGRGSGEGGEAAEDEEADQVPAAAVARALASARTFLDVDSAKIDLPVFNGDHKEWRPSPKMTLTRDAAPVDFFLTILPLSFWRIVTTNSNKYMGYRRMKDPSCYADAQPITLTHMLLYISALFLSGLNVVPSARKLFCRSLAFPGHRISDMFSRARWHVSSIPGLIELN